MTRTDKESWVIKLFNEGKTIREIAQEVHMSFGDISSVIKRETGEAEEQGRIRMSKSSQALQLFEQGKAPVEVAIKLDIQTKDVDRLYKEYWNLEGLLHLNQVNLNNL